MIDKKEKSAHGAATPLGTQLNRQANYNTDQKKSEIRKTAVEIFDLSLQLQEMTDGTIDWREPGVPCVQAEYHGAAAVLSVRIWEDGFNAGKEDVIVPNPVTLRPYRTFLEVEQPESKFIFRIREGSDGQPMFKLVEADGGLWKYEAVDAIKKYLTENLPKELLKVITIIG